MSVGVSVQVFASVDVHMGLYMFAQMCSVCGVYLYVFCVLCKCLCVSTCGNYVPVFV